LLAAFAHGLQAEALVVLPSIDQRGHQLMPEPLSGWSSIAPLTLSRAGSRRWSSATLPAPPRTPVDFEQVDVVDDMLVFSSARLVAAAHPA
jgi:hypothetical protein